MGREGLNINISLSISHFILTILSAWSFKIVNDKSALSQYVFLISCLYGLFGLLQYTLPRKFNTYFNLCICLIIQTFTLFLYTFDVLFLTQLYKDIILNVTIALIVIMIIILITNYLKARAKTIKLLLLTFYPLFAWIICILSYVIMYCNECYWMIGTISLLILNYVILIKLTAFYNLTFLEFSSISFCFFIYFAVRSINEISLTC